MTVDLDTFLVALYTIVDELYQRHVAPHRPVRRGRRAELSDSEVVTLMVCAQWHGRSERGFVRFARRYWRGYFPRLLDQGAFNRRVRDLTGALTQLVPVVADELGATMAPYQVIDGVGMPLARRTRGIHHRRFGDEAGIGRGGADKDWFFGCKVLLSCAPNGAVTGFVVGPADTEERWLAEAWACWRTGLYLGAVNRHFGVDELVPVVEDAAPAAVVATAAITAAVRPGLHERGLLTDVPWFALDGAVHGLAEDY